MAKPIGKDSHPASENIRTIAELEKQTARAQGWADRLSERVGLFVGSLEFLALHVIWFGGWIAWNTLAVPASRFDPYPFGLLVFIVAIESVLIATFVLIAQNRMSRQSDHRDHLDLQVDLLAEQEMTVVLRLLRRICDHLGIEADADFEQAQHLTERTNVYELMETIRRELPEKERRG